MWTDHFSVSIEQSLVCVFVYTYVQTIAFEQNDH